MENEQELQAQLEAKALKMEIKRFLLLGGFNETTGEVLEILSDLIRMCVQFEASASKNERNTFVLDKLSDATLRARLAYHIQKNYERVCLYIRDKFGYQISADYASVKNFVDQIAIVYTVFVQAEKDKAEESKEEKKDSKK